VPVVIVHGRDDRILPADAVRSLHEQVRGPRLLLETGGGHDDAGFDDIGRLGAVLQRFWPSDAGGIDDRGLLPASEGLRYRSALNGALR